MVQLRLNCDDVKINLILIKIQINLLNVQKKMKIYPPKNIKQFKQFSNEFSFSLFL